VVAHESGVTTGVSQAPNQCARGHSLIATQEMAYVLATGSTVNTRLNAGRAPCRVPPLVGFVHVCFRNIFCTAQCGSRGRTGWRVFLEAGQVKNHQSHHGRSVHGRSASPCPSFPRAPSRVHTKQQQLLLDRAFVPASCHVSRVCLMGVCVWPAITRATVMRSRERLMVLRLWDSIRVTPYPPTLCTTRVWPWFFRRSS
jgi:hypothetical protein